MVGWMLSRRVRSKTLKGDSWAFFLRDVLILLDLEVICLDEWNNDCSFATLRFCYYYEGFILRRNLSLI
jgi:hypothetical protein